MAEGYSGALITNYNQRDRLMFFFGRFQMLMIYVAIIMNTDGMIN